MDDSADEEHSGSDRQSSFRPNPTIARDGPDTIKIMLATDNHIGVWERDPVRGQDSLNTFKEILQLAVQHEVDFILLAGDLFHENKPSRQTMHGTMSLLRQYCMGDNPIKVELLSDPYLGVDKSQAEFPSINYEDPNFNVSIPVFSIHGNHDDPQGAGPDGALAALDMLSVAGLVNYFGKMTLSAEEDLTEDSGIRIQPVLLQKGVTKLALYGIGNLKDTRMHYELRANRVRMFRPSENAEDWFNILLIHQNRVPHGPQQSVPETMFDDCIDLVVWGHEHDCRIYAESVVEKPYYITQPGSSVATSLARGEEIQKHVGLVRVQGKNWEIEPLPLKTVRPFVWEDLVLADFLEERELNNASTDKAAINKLLRAKVENMIIRAERDWLRKFGIEGRYPTGHEPMLPLIRLRVDYTGYEVTNPVRFGMDFADKVANPRDILQFYKRKSQTKRDANSKSSSKVEIPEDYIDADSLPSEKLSKVRVSNLVQEYLSAQKLEILAENGLGDAVLSYVEKDDRTAISDFVKSSLDKMMKELKTQNPAQQRNVRDQDAALLTKITLAKNKASVDFEDQEPRKRVSKKKAVELQSRALDSMEENEMEPSDDNNMSDDLPPATKSKGKGRAAHVTASRSRAQSEDEEDDEDGDDHSRALEAPPPTKKSGRQLPASVSFVVTSASKRTAAKSTRKTAGIVKPPATRPKRKTTRPEPELFLHDDDDEDEEMLQLDSEEEEVLPQRRSRRK